MSTKISIVYSFPIHIYQECLSGDLCLEILNVNYEDMAITPLNEKYGDVVMNMKCVNDIIFGLQEWKIKTK